jgi:DNA-binding MarR family transcriptional regulator
MNLPPLLSSFANDFESVYKKRHINHSQLFWLHKLSRVNIKYLCLKNNSNYESQTTLLQYLILLEIEKNQRLSLRKIAENIGCDVNLVLKDIYGLIFNKSFNPKLEREKGLLLGNFDDTTEFKETDEVWFNFEFKNEHVRFSTIPMKNKKSEAETKKEQEIEELAMKKCQDNIIQAILTKIMKSHNGKKVQHSWLINEVSNQIIDFKAQPHQIKENIEKLIEKGFIKRDENEGNLYMYVA